MSRTKEISDFEYKKILKDVSGIVIEVDKWFPEEVADWITYHSTILGVAETYIAFPLCTAIAYCAQHATVKLSDDMHQEPVLLYSLVAGRSGTNKSASLSKILDMILRIDNPNGNHEFDTGTLEGLMKGMRGNNECIFSANDEFATFYESMEKSGSNLEKSRFLSLYSCSRWAKSTKNNGECSLEDPRFNFVSCTQPRYAVNFAHNNLSDGFFQRFLLSIPPEKFYKRKEKKDMQKQVHKNRLDMQKLLNTLYNLSAKKDIIMVLDDEAEELYDQHHDEATTFRKNNIFEERRVSSMSKSIGLSMRLAGIICLLRNVISILDEQEENEEEENEEDEKPITFTVIKSDFNMALKITLYSLKTSFSLMPDHIEQGRVGTSTALSRIKLPVLEPENFTIDYAIENCKIVKKYLCTPSVPLSQVSRDKMYPIVNNVQGTAIGKKFVNGLKNIGLGFISPTCKSFKRYDLEDSNCPDRESLKRKYRLLNIDLDERNVDGPSSSD